MGRKTETYFLNERTPRSPGNNSSTHAWNYNKKNLGGVIFGCTHRTIRECLSNLIFGLPVIHFSYIKHIEPGLPLFLFNYSDRTLHGIYEAASQGQMNINPHGWTEDGSEKTHYPAQVRVRVRNQCHFLKEKQYKGVLHKNYYKQIHFRFELDHEQTDQLISLFESSPLTSSLAMFYHGASTERSLCGPVPVTVSRPEDEDFESPATEDACSTQYMESELPAELPSKRKWISLFRDDLDLETTCEDGEIIPFNSEGDEENSSCLNASHISSGPSGINSSWEEGKRTSHLAPTGWEDTSGPLSSSPCWEEGKGTLDLAPTGWDDSSEPCWEEETGQVCNSPYREEEKWSPGITPCGHAVKPSDVKLRWGGWEDWEDWEDKKEETAQEGTTPCLEEDTGLVGTTLMEVEETGPLSSTPVCTVETHLSTTQSDEEASGSEQERIYCKLKQLALDREKLNCGKDVSVPCATDNPDLEDECCPAASSAIVNFANNSSESQSVIDQLRQELPEVKALSVDQKRKICELEKKQVDSGVLLKQLRKHISLLESNLQDHSTAGVKMGNSSYRNELSTEPSGEPCLAADKMITLMGGYDGVSWLPAVDCYSPSTDIVRSLKPMSSARSYAQAVLLNGIIYNFGGWNGDHNLWYDTVECYNLSSNEWISCPSLSEKKGGLAGASLHNKIFAVGGGNEIDCFREVEVFVPAVGRWIRTKSLLEKRFASAAAELDGVLYVVGGYDGNNYSKSAERFDPREASWSKLESMNTSRGSHALSVFDGKLYALGGYDGNTYVPSIEVYDPCKGLWMAGDEMKQPRGNFVAPVIGETMYAIGGQVDGGSSIVDTVEIYKSGHGWSVTKMKGVGKRCFFSAVLH